jgi:hypothetical protein
MATFVSFIFFQPQHIFAQERYNGFPPESLSVFTTGPYDGAWSLQGWPLVL